MKKLVLVMTLLFLILFTACNKKDETQKYYYETSFIDLSDLLQDVDSHLAMDRSTLLSGHFTADGKWMTHFTLDYSEDIELIAEKCNQSNQSNMELDYYVTSSYNQTSCILIFDPITREKNVIPLSVPFDDSETYLRMDCFIRSYVDQLPDGSLIAATHYWYQPILEKNYSYYANAGIETNFLSHFDSEGRLISKTLLYDIHEDFGRPNTYIYYVADKNGIVYISDNKTVAAVTPDGDCLYSFSFQDSFEDSAKYIIYTPSLTLDQEGNACLKLKPKNNQSSASEVVLYRIHDPATGKILSDPIVIKSTVGITAHYFTPESDVYLSNTLGLYCENSEDDSELLTYWMDVDLSGDSIFDLIILSPESMMASYYDTVTEESFIVMLQRTDQPPEQQRQFVDLAFEEINHLNGSEITWAHGRFLECASSFNRQSDTYRIKLHAYNTDDQSSANDKLMRDMVDGNLPDAVLFAGSITPEAFIKTGIYRDMYAFMDADEVYQRDAFLPCVLEPFELSDGSLPYLTINFAFETLAGKASNLGTPESWTIDDMQDLLASLDAGQFLLRVDESDSPPLELLKILLPSVLGDAIDYEKKTCGVNGTLKEVIALCKDTPLYEGEKYLSPDRYTSDQIILEQVKIPSAGDYVTDMAAVFLGEEVHFIGFPVSDEENGTLINSLLSIAITGTDEASDGAWEFIKYYFEVMAKDWKSFNDKITWLHITQGLTPTYEASDRMFEVLDKLAVYLRIGEANSETGDGIDISSEYSYHPVDHPATPNEFIATYKAEFYAKQGVKPLPFTDSDEAFFRDLFETCTRVKSTDGVSMAIILEEASNYYAGIATLDETIARIEDRIETRLNE